VHLFLPAPLWDHANMSKDRRDETEDATPQAAAPPEPSGDSENVTTRPTPTVGQRRREAEQKLEQHLEEARHKGEEEDKGGEER
jgi:hypothetical protein